MDLFFVADDDDDSWGGTLEYDIMEEAEVRASQDSVPPDIIDLGRNFASEDVPLRIISSSSSSSVHRAPASDVEVIDLSCAPVSTQQQVAALFPDADPAYVQQKLMEGNYNVEWVCNELLEHPDYPKRPKEQKLSSKPTPTKKEPNDSDLLIIDLSATVPTEAQNAILLKLSDDFPRVHLDRIKACLHDARGHYHPAKRAIKKYMESTHYKPLKTKRPRSRRTVPSDMNEIAQSELSYSRHLDLKELTANDEKVAQELNESMYEEEGQLIECECCSGEVPFDALVQCAEGHLFCKDCVVNYVKTAAYDAGQNSLSCFSPNTECKATFLRDCLERVVPEELMAKFEERTMHDVLAKASINLHRCPAPDCDYSVLIDDPSIRVLECQNPSCMLRSCVHCKADWEGHFGKSCKEVEDNDSTKKRTAIEEKMTQALTRNCPSCGVPFLKTDGCNKMTCRCGALSCFVCRVLIPKEVAYRHFCQHPREPGSTTCKHCKLCFLWEKTEDLDLLKVKEIKEQGEKETGIVLNIVPDLPKAPPAPAPAPIPAPPRAVVHVQRHPQRHHRRHVVPAPVPVPVPAPVPPHVHQDNAALLHHQHLIQMAALARNQQPQGWPFPARR